MKIKLNEHEFAIGCHSELGPTFGGGHDIHIANNANTKMNCLSDFGYYLFTSSI
jgi:hypothetical protein